MPKTALFSGKATPHSTGKHGRAVAKVGWTPPTKSKPGSELPPESALIRCVKHVFNPPELPQNTGRYPEVSVYTPDRNQRLYGGIRIAQGHGFNDLSR